MNAQYNTFWEILGMTVYCAIIYGCVKSCRGTPSTTPPQRNLPVGLPRYTDIISKTTDDTPPPYQDGTLTEVRTI